MNALAYLLFTALLAVVFAAIVFHYYGRKRFARVEEPKYRMLADDDNNVPGQAGKDAEE